MHHRTRSESTGSRGRRPLLAAVAIGCLAVTASLRADTVTLRDGTVLTGAVRQVEGGYDFTHADGTRRFLTAEQVKSITLTNEGRITPGVARERLQSLQRSVENERDISRIIDRYQQFIEMNGDTEAAQLAQQELDEWRRKRDAGQTIHYGRDWITSAERDRRLIAAAQRVGQIAQMMTAGQIDEAANALHAELDQQPDNVSYLYLNGVLQLRAGRFAEAKRSFDQVEQQVPGHPPTLLNQAVLATEAKRWPQALRYLDQALAGAPGAPDILDAITEFANLLPDQSKRTPPFDHLMQRYQPQEAAYEQQQATRGLYRWGSRWVDQATLDQYRAEQAAFEKKKSDLEAQYNDIQTQIARIDQDMARTQQIMRQMQMDSVVIMPDGRTVNRGLPPAYWDCQRDLENMGQQRQQLERSVGDLRRQADDLKRTEPHPPYTGHLAPIGEQGVPVLLPAQRPPEPGTQPATTPPAAPPPSTSQPSAPQRLPSMMLPPGQLFGSPTPTTNPAAP